MFVILGATHKRAVASLTWELGCRVPSGVVVNALSPIAATRMVTAALAAAGGSAATKASSSKGPSSERSRTGGLSLGAMPSAEQLGPIGAHLVGEDFDACRGQVLFACGSEVTVIRPPRVLEAVRTTDATSLPHVLSATADALVAAEASQASTGGANARFGPIFEEDREVGTEGAVEPGESSPVRSCALIADRPDVAGAVAATIAARGVDVTRLDVPVSCGFDEAARHLQVLSQRAEGLDAVVVVTGAGGDGAGDGWEAVLGEHAGVAQGILADAGWARAVADLAAASDRRLRLVTAVDATTAGGRSRAQASAQLSRSGVRATDGRVAAFAVSVESATDEDRHALGELTAHLVSSPGAEALSGAELVVGEGWAGLRSHPVAAATITYGGPDVPEWFDGALRRVLDG